MGYPYPYFCLCAFWGALFRGLGSLGCRVFCLFTAPVSLQGYSIFKSDVGVLYQGSRHVALLCKVHLAGFNLRRRNGWFLQRAFRRWFLYGFRQGFLVLGFRVEGLGFRN